MAILGNCPVVCHVIAYLLHSGGYETRIVDTARCVAAPAEADIVLVTAGTDSGDRGQGLLAPETPVLRLVDTPEEKAALGDGGILWPCTVTELHARVSSALAGVSGATVLETPGEAGAGV